METPLYWKQLISYSMGTGQAKCKWGFFKYVSIAVATNRRAETNC